jgi:hypothetical protein
MFGGERMGIFITVCFLFVLCRNPPPNITNVPGDITGNTPVSTNIFCVHTLLTKWTQIFLIFVTDPEAGDSELDKDMGLDAAAARIQAHIRHHLAARSCPTSRDRNTQSSPSSEYAPISFSRHHMYLLLISFCLQPPPPPPPLPPLLVSSFIPECRYL